MADRQIGVIVDVKSESVKFATDRTIGLREQLRMLKKEQSRLLSIGQEGSKEFTILSNAINNTQDDLERSNQKAKDLFATFSLIPGPVGEFAGKVNGAVSALKLLSGFTIKDIGNQFKEFGKDIGEIGKNIKNFGLDLLGLRLKPDITNELSQAQNATKALSSSVAESTAQVNANTVSENVNTASTLENSKAQTISTDTKIQDVQATNQDTKATTTNTLAVLESTIVKEKETLARLKEQQANIDSITTIDEENKAILKRIKQNQIQTSELKINTLEQQKSTLTTQANTVVTNTNTTSENVNTVSNTTNTLSRKALTIAIAQQTAFTRVLTTAMTALGVSEYYAATAALALKAALRAIGIGILIQLASVLIGKLMDLIPFFNETSDATKKAADNTEAYTKALDKNSQSLEKNLQQIDYQTKKKKLLAEINGSSAKEILKITQNGLEQEKQLYSKQIGDLQALRAKASKDSKLNVEERAKTLDSIDKKIVESSKNYVKKREEIEFAGLEYAKTIAEQRRKDSETATDLLLELQNKFNVQTAKNARDKEDIELQIQKDAEEKKINALQISNERKLELLKQLNANYAAIVLQNGQKRNEEDAKIAADNLAKALQFQRERSNILLAATADEVAQQKEQRRQKYEDDLKALKENTEYLKLGIFDRAMLLIALQKKLNLDLKKIDDDKRKQDNDDLIKKLDDELKFLQIANEAKVEGTKAFYDGQRQILDLAQKRELAQLDLTEDQKTRIKEKYVKLRKDLDKQELNSYLQMATALLGAASNIVSDIAEVNQLQMEVDLQKAGDNAEKQEEIKKKYFEKNKKTQIAQAIIGTLQAAIQAYQSLAVIPVVGPALGAVAAAAALVFGYKKVDLIKQQQYQSSSTGSASVEKPAMANYGRNYEKGGYIDGPRHAQGGVMIEAEGGEAVMTRGAVTMFSPLLSAMNQIGGGTSFQPGAVGAPRPDAPLLNKPAENQAPLIMKTYVVENELTSIQQRQARLKDLSTL